MNVAIFIYDKVEILDFTGPGEVFASANADSDDAFNLYTVAAEDPIQNYDKWKRRFDHIKIGLGNDPTHVYCRRNGSLNIHSKPDIPAMGICQLSAWH